MAVIVKMPLFAISVTWCMGASCAGVHRHSAPAAASGSRASLVVARGAAGSIMVGASMSMLFRVSVLFTPKERFGNTRILRLAGCCERVFVAEMDLGTDAGNGGPHGKTTGPL